MAGLLLNHTKELTSSPSVETSNFLVDTECLELPPLLLETLSCLLIIQFHSKFNSGKSILGIMKLLGFMLMKMLFFRKIIMLQMVNKFVDKEVTGMNTEKILTLSLPTVTTPLPLFLLPVLMKLLITNHLLLEISILTLLNALKSATHVNMDKVKLNAQAGNFSNGPGLKMMFPQKDGIY
jgi:hypothetical protein